jgi:hypothetical protein
MYTKHIITSFEIAMFHLGTWVIFGSSTFWDLLWFLIWLFWSIKVLVIKGEQPLMEIIDNICKFVADSVVNRVGKEITSTVKGVKETLQEAGDDLSKGAFQHITTNVRNHVCGIGLSLTSAVQAESLTQLASETGKIMSFIGLEQSLVNKAVGALATLTADNIQPDFVNEAGFEDIEKAIPLLASAMAMGGVEVGKSFDVNFGIEKYLDRTAKKC